jgi:hypothetical protein
LPVAGSTPDLDSFCSYFTTLDGLQPRQPHAAGSTYTATLTSGITDAAGNALTPKTWTFTTLAPTDTTAPTVINTIPKNNATGVSRTNNITAAFSEMVTNVNTTTFTLTPTNGTTNVSAKVTYNSTGDRWVLNPDVTLSPTTSYTATITSGVTDLAGNAFAGTTWTFTTGA